MIFIAKTADIILRNSFQLTATEAISNARNVQVKKSSEISEAYQWAAQRIHAPIAQVIPAIGVQGMVLR
jgi:hypothetical protein